jgi:hypothetical protein
MIRDITGLHRDIMNIPVKEDCTMTSEYRLGHRDARHAAAELVNSAVALESNKRAPVQKYPEGIPWELHLEAYAAYCKRWSPQPALIEGWCRGGFSMEELDGFVPGWRNKVSEIYCLKVRILELHKEVEKLKGELLSRQSPSLTGSLRPLRECPDDERGIGGDTNSSPTKSNKEISNDIESIRRE